MQRVVSSSSIAALNSDIRTDLSPGTSTWSHTSTSVAISPDNDDDAGEFYKFRLHDSSLSKLMFRSSYFVRATAQKSKRRRSDWSQPVTRILIGVAVFGFIAVVCVFYTPLCSSFWFFAGRCIQDQHCASIPSYFRRNDMKSVSCPR